MMSERVARIAFCTSLLALVVSLSAWDRASGTTTQDGCVSRAEGNLTEQGERKRHLQHRVDARPIEQHTTGTGRVVAHYDRCTDDVQTLRVAYRIGEHGARRVVRASWEALR